MSNTLLEVKDLKSYFYLASGVLKAVDGVSFSMQKGEVLGIVGESGCGKSVTASSLIRLLPKNVGKIAGGEVLFAGKDVLKLSNSELLRFRGSQVSMIFQDPMTSLDPVFKVGNQMVENIRAHHKEISVEQATKMSIDALQAVGIPNPDSRFNAYPHELSGGMCQRVIIAMAICCAPELLIADEPTTALDVTVQSQVLKLLEEMKQKHQTAILLITHNLGVVWRMCDTVMVMYAGKTVERATTKELYQSPLHPYTWGLLDSYPKLSNDSTERLRTISGSPPDLRLTGDCCNFYSRCPYAVERCAHETPDLLEIEPGHLLACHRQTVTQRLERGGKN